MDRIAEAADSSKAMIYAYFESKDRLFDAVFDALVVQNLHDVPLDINNLPEYAARQYDQHLQHPEVLRLSFWDTLERAGQGLKASAVTDTTAHKISQLRLAQQRGVISDRFEPHTLLELILALTQMHAVSDAKADQQDRRRAAIKEAVQALI